MNVAASSTRSAISETTTDLAVYEGKVSIAASSTKKWQHQCNDANSQTKETQDKKTMSEICRSKLASSRALGLMFYNIVNITSTV